MSVIYIVVGAHTFLQLGRVEFLSCSGHVCPVKQVFVSLLFDKIPSVLMDINKIKFLIN